MPLRTFLVRLCLGLQRAMHLLSIYTSGPPFETLRTQHSDVFVMLIATAKVMSSELPKLSDDSNVLYPASLKAGDDLGMFLVS